MYLSKCIVIKSHKNIVLPFVLCAYETWPLTTRIKYVFVKKVLGTILVPTHKV